jgi:hypothetical protein
VQTGNFNQCRTTENINYQRARRKDAEPIIRYKDGLSALSIFNVQLSKNRRRYNKMIITISREFGSGGRELGKRLMCWKFHAMTKRLLR